MCPSRGSNCCYLEFVVAWFTTSRCRFQKHFHMITWFFGICDVILLQEILNPLLSFAVAAATLAVFLFGTVFVNLNQKVLLGFVAAQRPTFLCRG